MRSGFLLLLLLRAATAFAGPVFPIGSGEIDARHSNAFDLAQTRQGSISAWITTDAINIAWFDKNVAIAGRTVLPPSRAATVQIASTGAEELLVHGSYAPDVVFARRIDGDAISAARPLPLSGIVEQLEWTGRAYALVVRNADTTFSMMLLDRDGAPASGIIHFKRIRGLQALLACGDNRCLVGFPSWFDDGVAVVDGDEFPPPGEKIDRFPLHLPNQRSIGAVGFDELGFYSVVHDYRGTQLLWHGRLRRGLRNGLFDPQRAIPIPSSGVTISHGGAIYIASGPSLSRVTRAGRVEKIDVGHVPRGRAAVQLIVHGSVSLIWKGDETGGYYASRIEGNALQDARAPVSPGFAVQHMPRITRGTTTSLAVWHEAFGYRRSLLAAMVDDDGRQVSVPVHLAAVDVDDVVIAFDGVNFLVLWSRSSGLSRGVAGHFVSQDGQLLGERIAFDPNFFPEMLTLVWTGSEYWTTGFPNVATRYTGILRISAAGQFLEPYRSVDFYNGDNLLLARDEDGRLRGLAVEYRSSIIAAGPGMWATYGWAEVAEGSTGPTIDVRGESGEYAPMVIPAVACGGGRCLAIFDTSGWALGDLVTWHCGEVPYPLPPWPGHLLRLHAHWSGTEFIVLAGKTLARHATDCTISTISLGDDVVDSAGVGAGPDAVLVLRQRGEVIEAERVKLPAH
jgi:hypothetical protein